LNGDDGLPLFFWFFGDFFLSPAQSLVLVVNNVEDSFVQPPPRNTATGAGQKLS